MLDKIDLAVLHPTHTNWEIQQACYIAHTNKMASICVKPCDVGYTKQFIKFMEHPYNLKLSTVIDFPHGNLPLKAKLDLIERSLKYGAEEFDIVIPFTSIFEKAYADLDYSLDECVKAASDKTVKIILETGYLTKDQIIKVCQIAKDVGADYIKTSTGFGPRGATEEDIEIIKKACNLKIKASGGIKTYTQAKKFIDLGCDRLGIGLNSIQGILNEISN